MDTPNSTLLGVYRMLADDEYRKEIVSHVKDPIVKLFWEKDFEGYPSQFRKEVASPIQNKIGQLLTNTPLRNIVRSTIDYIAFHGQAIFTINLAEGLAKNGHTVLALVGSERGHAYQTEHNGVHIHAVNSVDLSSFILTQACRSSRPGQSGISSRLFNRILSISRIIISCAVMQPSLPNALA